jgi:hypothetical protein
VEHRGYVLVSAALLSVTGTVKLILLLSLCREVLRRATPDAAPSLADAAVLVLALKGRRGEALRELREVLASAKGETAPSLVADKAFVSDQPSKTREPAPSSS